MAVVRWMFEDPNTLATYSFAINPSEGGSPAYAKNFQYSNTSAPDGKVIVFEGREQPQKIDFTGTLLTEEEYNAFVTWWEKRYQITVTDDLGRSFNIILESFQPKRERARSHPWKHSYQVTATIVNWE